MRHKLIDTPMEERRPRRSFHVWAGLALVAFALTGCSTLPARSAAPPPPAASASNKALAKAVDMVGHRGRLSAAQREAVLKRVYAQGNGGLLQRHLAVMTAQDEVDLYSGNEVTLLVDGPATFKAMFEAVESARESIYLESYIIEESSIADRMAALLLRKKAQGVAVHVIYDSVGSIGMDAAYFARLTEAGVGVCAFNPVNPLRRPGYWGINHRDHRKILVVDGQQAFTGGINISGAYSSGSFSAGGRSKKEAAKEGWRDTQVRLRGPSVGAFERLFRETWVKQGCKPALPAATPARAIAAAGPHVVRVIGAAPDEGDSQIYTTLLSAIDTAQRSVHLTMAYFAPGEDMIAALSEAAQRGADVVLILPSLSDFSLILEAGRSYYGRLLDAGVKIHELNDAVLHAKTAVIDGVVSTVGSSNLDWRSFVANNEVNAVVLGEDFGERMEEMFRRDLQQSKAITRAAWDERPYGRRWKEWLGRMLERLL